MKTEAPPQNGWNVATQCWLCSFIICNQFNLSTISLFLKKKIMQGKKVKIRAKRQRKEKNCQFPPPIIFLMVRHLVYLRCLMRSIHCTCLSQVSTPFFSKKVLYSKVKKKAEDPFVISRGHSVGWCIATYQRAISARLFQTQFSSIIMGLWKSFSVAHSYLLLNQFYSC